MNNSLELLPEDIEYLNAHYPSWEILAAGDGKFGIRIDAFSIPDRLCPNVSNLLILVTTGYPLSALDMFYFNPPITRSDGREIANLVNEEHFGKTWQRWSRHYSWKAGEDNLVRHIEHVKEELSSASS